jgi:CheY-like chemotaxis protein
MTIMKPESDAWGGDLHISLKLMDCADSHLRTECSEASQNSSWLLSVADTGVGMDSSVKEHIFTPFFTTKKKGVGSGLGLSMAYSIIKQHCGDLMVHSEPGQGSTFHILLPALHQQNNDYQRAGNLNNSTLPAGTGSILVVDDDIAIRENVFQILTQCGYTVILADNGVEGIRLAKLLGADIRLVLLDMIMPVLSGMDALPQIKVSVPHAKILLTSGFKQDPRVLSLLAKGAVDDFIQKPYQLNQLAWQIQALLTISEQQDCTIIGKT